MTTPRGQALTILADLREDAAIVRYLGGLGFEGKREPQGVAGSGPFPQPVAAARPSRAAGAPLATPPIHLYLRRRGRPSRRGAEQKAGKFARLLFVAVAAPIVFVLLLLRELALRISGRRPARGQE